MLLTSKATNKLIDERFWQKSCFFMGYGMCELLPAKLGGEASPLMILRRVGR
jgi:hypothetical protein